MRAGTWSHHAATGVVQAGPCVLERVVVGSVAAGQTVAIHDVAATADAAAGNLVSTIDLDQFGTYEFGAVMGRGCCVVVSGGTPSITVVRG